MAKEPPKPDFSSKEEFHALCHYMSMRLHYLNRVAMGEQKFTGEVAELLSDLGRVFDDHYKDPATRAAFGDGWEEGTVPKAERRQYLVRLMTDRK